MNPFRKLKGLPVGRMAKWVAKTGGSAASNAMSMGAFEELKKHADKIPGFDKIEDKIGEIVEYTEEIEKDIEARDVLLNIKDAQIEAYEKANKNMRQVLDNLQPRLLELETKLQEATLEKKL